ncbi:sensor histidine kinase [Porphyromonas macacae]|uniref:sensor histidine kinase n=1 Tax=Porphyromonas macacae TaxID=28115 RepID=UPI0024ACF971|nr:histidine kinase [Porphyromonas macacae]
MKLFQTINNAIVKSLKENNSGRFRHVILLFIIGVMTLEMLYNSSARHGRFEYSKFYEWFMYFLIIAGMVYFNLKVLVPRFLLKGKLASYFYSILPCAILTLFFTVLTQNMLFNKSLDDDTSNVLLLNIAGNIISMGLVIVATSVYALFRGWAEQSQRISELETTTIEAELQQLKNQINPHFLFNTINNANIKVEKDPELAYNIITKLEDLLRYQLTETSQETVYLKDEISFLFDYLALGKTRRERFCYTLQIDNKISDLEIPPLLFIPFVENAVKHSLTAKGKSVVRISFEQEGEQIHFYCENTKPAVPVKHKSGGLGLRNINRRLDLLYGNNYTLDIAESDTNYVVHLYLKI